VAAGAVPPPGGVGGRRKLYAAVIVAIVVVAGVLIYVAAPAPYGLGAFEHKSPSSPSSSLSSSAAVQCAVSPCTESISVTANSILFMGFGYSEAQAVAGTMSIHGYPFTIADEYTKQNFGGPSIQAGFYYWVINANATVKVYLNYSTPAIADVSLEDFTGLAVTSLPSIFAMGDGSGTSVTPTTTDVCDLGATYAAGETVIAVTMTGEYQSSSLTPESSPIAASILPGEVSTDSGALLGEYGVLPSQAPTVVTATLASPTPYATVCLGLIPA
jgi:hypothetical protein